MQRFFWKLKMRLYGWRMYRRARKTVRSLMKCDLTIPTANGDILNRRGEILGSGRRPGENDNDYRVRLYEIVKTGRK